MRGHHRRWAVVFFVLVVATAVGWLPQSHAQDSPDDGHSYMRITIGDRVLTNFVSNDEYQNGWLGVEFVLVKNTGQTHAPGGNIVGVPKGWGLLSAEMKSGHHGPGTLSFGV